MKKQNRFAGMKPEDAIAEVEAMFGKKPNPIEEAVPVSDPVAEAVGRLTDAIAECNEQEPPLEFAQFKVSSISAVISALAKAGERIADLEEWQRLHEPMVADGAALTDALGLVDKLTKEKEAAEAQLAEANRLLKGRDDFLVERDLFSEFAAWIAGQPVPDPTPGGFEMITNDEAMDAARRLIAGAFRRDGEDLPSERRPRFSIPAQPDRDDDLVLMAYLKDAAALREARQQEREMVEGEIVGKIVASIREDARFTKLGQWVAAALEATADQIEQGDWKHSAGTGEG